MGSGLGVIWALMKKNFQLKWSSKPVLTLEIILPFVFFYIFAKVFPILSPYEYSAQPEGWSIYSTTYMSTWNANVLAGIYPKSPLTTAIAKELNDWYAAHPDPYSVEPTPIKVFEDEEAYLASFKNESLSRGSKYYSFLSAEFPSNYIMPANLELTSPNPSLQAILSEHETDQYHNFFPTHDKAAQTLSFANGTQIDLTTLNPEQTEDLFTKLITIDSITAKKNINIKFREDRGAGEVKTYYDPEDNVRNEPDSQFIRFQTLMMRGLLRVEGLHKAYNLEDAEAKINFEFNGMPFTEYKWSAGLVITANVLGVITTLGYLASLSSIISMLVQEREYKIKHLFELMGLTKFHSYMALFLTQFTISIIPMLASAGVFYSIGSSAIPFVVLFGIMFVQFLAVIAFGILISVFFQSTKTAQSVATMVYLIVTGMSCASSALPIIIQKILAIISFQAVYGEFILNLTTQHFHTYAQIVYTIPECFGVLALQIIVYFILAIYIANILPGEDASPLPPWYPLLPSYWKSVCCVRAQNETPNSSTRLLDDALSSDDLHSTTTLSSRFIQPLSQAENSQVAIRLRNVIKQFGDFTAVDNLSIDFVSGSCCALIGHNGCGKSVTLSMISGLFPQSSGSIEIFDRNGRKVDYPQGQIGFCSQQNTLFPLLSPKQHLQLFSKIKQHAMGKTLSDAEVDAEINSLLDRLKLGPRGDNKGDAPTQTLSGGQKRKVCLAMALLHKPPVIFLDEPSTGVDIAIQREIWAIIEQEKKSDGGKCIILTSHDMNECEIGDRIAILLKGQLMCYGSSIFLKEAFDIGYMLSLQKQKALRYDRIIGQVDTSINKDSAAKVFGGSQLGQMTTSSGQKIYDKIVQVHPEWRKHLHVHNDTQSEIVFAIKFEHSDKLPGLLDSIDQMLAELQVTTVSLGVTTLDDVFLLANSGITISDAPINASLSSSLSQSQTGTSGTYGGNETPDLRQPLSHGPSSPNEFQINQELWDEEQVKLHPVSLAARQILAIFLKRVGIQLRSYKSLFKIIIFPLILMLLIFWLSKSFTAPPPYEISSHRYAPDMPVEYSVFAPQPDVPLWDPTSANEFSKTLASTTTTNPVPVVPDEQFLKVLDLSPSDPDQMNFAYNINREAWALQQYADIQKYSPLNPRYMNFEIHHLKEVDTTTHDVTLNGMSWFNMTNAQSVASSQLHFWNSVANLVGLDINISILYQKLPQFTSELLIKAGTLGVVFGCSIVFPQTIAYFLVKERQDKIFHLHTLSGIRVYSYWLGNFLFDLMLFLIMSVVLVVSIIALRLPHIHFDVLITALATYGPASILFLYWFQTFFDKPAAAQLVTGLALVLGPFIVGGIILGVGLASEWTPTQMDHALKITFIFPSAAIFIPLVIQYLNEINNFKIDGTSFFWISIGLAFGHLGMVILTQILNSYGLFNRVFESAVLPINPPDSDVDSNVVQVNQYVRSKEWMQDPDATLVASGLRKVYKGFTAVNSVSFECKKGSVFALLGANGSGKSSCINMLTAEVKPSQSVQSQYDPTIEHTAYIDKFDVVKNPLDCYHNVGVCPQFDALSLELTGRQTLNFYCFVRGISSEKRILFVNDLLNALGIDYAADRAISTYSLGMRRRLSIGVALVGNPACVLLDEATSGVDPISRANIALFLKRTCSNRALLITSHIMSDLEALADDLCILTYGNVKAIGNKAELKHKLGNEWTVHLSITADRELQTVIRTLSELSQIKVSPQMDERLAKLDNLVLRVQSGESPFSDYAEALEALKNDPDYKLFIDACKNQGFRLVEQRYATAVLNVQKTLFSLSSLFSKMQQIKDSSPHIVTYSCSQIPLEQVFVSIVEKADALKNRNEAAWYSDQTQQANGLQGYGQPGYSQPQQYQQNPQYAPQQQQQQQPQYQQYSQQQQHQQYPSHQPHYGQPPQN